MTAIAPRPVRKAAKMHVVPERKQLAALCWRPVPGGDREILLVTSSNGRWILPKGWPMDGKSNSRAARIEAWEEAGVARAKVARKPLGRFIGSKVTLQGDEVPCLTQVYAMRVAETADDWPEREKRARRWVAVEEAAEIVTEDGLRDILRKF